MVNGAAARAACTCHDCPACTVGHGHAHVACSATQSRYGHDGRSRTTLPAAALWTRVADPGPAGNVGGGRRSPRVKTQANFTGASGWLPIAQKCASGWLPIARPSGPSLLLAGCLSHGNVLLAGYLSQGNVPLPGCLSHLQVRGGSRILRELRQPVACAAAGCLSQVVAACRMCWLASVGCLSAGCHFENLEMDHGGACIRQACGMPVGWLWCLHPTGLLWDASDAGLWDACRLAVISKLPCA
jgi:hypothetical protein